MHWLETTANTLGMILSLLAPLTFLALCLVAARNMRRYQALNDIEGWLDQVEKRTHRNFLRRRVLSFLASPAHPALTYLVMALAVAQVVTGIVATVLILR